MEVIPCGSPLGQAVELSLEPGESFRFPAERLLWSGAEVILDEGAWGVLGRVATLMGAGALRGWMTAEAAHSGARIGLRAPWGWTMALVEGTPGLLVQTESLCGHEANAQVGRAHSKLLRGPCLEIRSESSLLLAGRGGLVSLSLKLGEEILCHPAQPAAVELEGGRSGRSGPHGLQRFVGPGRLFLHSVPPAIKPGRLKTEGNP